MELWKTFLFYIEKIQQGDSTIKCEIISCKKQIVFLIRNKSSYKTYLK